MIISRTPFRISFFGGGTDYPEWFKKHGGAVFSSTIDKYCYISCRYLPQFFEHKYRIVYSNIENTKSIDDISHPAVRAILRHYKCQTGLEIHHDGDLPARSGLGSSSSFTVGLINAISLVPNRFRGAIHRCRILRDRGFQHPEGRLPPKQNLLFLRPSWQHLGLL